LAAQSARIGVAESEFYPRIALTGDVGVSANQFGDLFRNGSSFGSVGPSFRWSILHYGRLLANVEVQDARFQQALASYQQTVLLANLEAENAVISFLKNQERLKAQLEAAEAADKTNDLIRLLLEEGEADFNRVFNVQNFKTQQEESAAVAKGAVAQSLIAIYRSLGGGWPSPYLGADLPTSSGAAPAAEEVPPGEAASAEGAADERSPLEQADERGEPAAPRPAAPGAGNAPDGLEAASPAAAEPLPPQ
jgi:outer membrane protein TolC